MGTQHELQIDGAHCRAICDEIGERLRVILARDSSALPHRLQSLMDQFAEQDLVSAPSIAPSLEDMIWPAAPVAVSLANAA